MSIYINFEDDQNKADWLVEYGITRHMGKDKSYLTFDDIKKYGNGDEDLVLVVWGKPNFEVLIVIHSASELAYFDQDDGIEKHWAYVPNDIVMSVSPEYKKLYYANNADMLNNDVLEFGETYLVRHNYNTPFIEVMGIKYKIDLDFLELGLDLDGDTIAISMYDKNYCTSASRDMGIRICVMEELRFDMVIDTGSDYALDKKKWLMDNLEIMVGGITPDRAWEDIQHSNKDLVLVVWRETESLDVLAVVYDKKEYARHNLDDSYDKTWAYVSKEVVANSCSDYKKMLFRPNISNCFIKKEAIRKILRRYEKQSGRKFNPEKVKYANNNVMLLALYGEANSFAEIAVHDGVDIADSRAIAADALTYLVMLGLKEY